jgi:hypothetical protein
LALTDVKKCKFEGIVRCLNSLLCSFE